MKRKIEVKYPEEDRGLVDSIILECHRQVGRPATKVTMDGKIRLAIPNGVSNDLYVHWHLRLNRL